MELIADVIHPGGYGAKNLSAHNYKVNSNQITALEAQEVGC